MPVEKNTLDLLIAGDHTVPFSQIDKEQFIRTTAGCEKVSVGIFDMSFLTELTADLADKFSQANVLLVRSKTGDTVLLVFVMPDNTYYAISGDGISGRV